MPHKPLQYIHVDDQKIPYRIRFSKRAKYLQLRIVSSNEVEVVIPRRGTVKDGERLLREKSDWIKKHFADTPVKKQKYFLFGRELVVIHSHDLFLKHHSFSLNENELKIISPQESSLNEEELVNVFLRHKAKNYLPVRTRILAEKYGFEIRKIGIRGQKTRWGSCSSKGNLSFNFKLLQFKKETIDYVIIHELCHLIHMNHSPKFWKLVESFCKDYKVLKKEIKKTGVI